MSEYELIQKLVREMQSSETPVLPVYEANLFSIAKAAYKQARAEVIEEITKAVLGVDEFGNAHIPSDFLTKLSEVEK